MNEYQLQILRNQVVVDSYSTAEAILNAYPYHHVGQPLAVLYRQGDEVRVLFAIGKKDYDDPSIQPGEPTAGSLFYDIINRDFGAETAVMKWRILGTSDDETPEVTHALYRGPHTNLTGEDAGDFRLGTLIYCNDGVIARVKKLKESESETIDDWYEFYGNAGDGDPHDIFWQAIGTDFEQHVAFETGTQSEYEEATKVDEHLYVTTDPDKRDRLYKGEHLLGDAYVSEESTNAVVATGIGGIAAGTTLQSLLDATDGSVSKVLDMMLFPAYAPQYEGPSGSITIPQDLSQYIYKYDILPVAVTSSSPARTYTPNGSVYGGVGSAVVTRTMPDGTTDDGSTSLSADQLGTYTYSARLSFGIGSDLILDTKGNPAQGWATNATTPISAALSTQHLQASGEGFVIEAQANIRVTSKTITSVLPIWIGQPGSAEPTLQSPSDSALIQTSGKAGVQLNSSQGRSAATTSEANSWYIDIPAGKTLKVILRGLDGTYPDTNVQQIKLLPFVGTRYGVWTCSGGTNVQIPVDRYVYNGAAYSGGLHKIIVS